MKILNKVILPINHPFINNKYTSWYYAIIHFAKTRDLTFNYVEKHHIIPQSFFIKCKKGGVPGWLSGNPNTKDNIVSLTFKEHFVCHWLLTKMTNGIAYQKSLHAMTFFGHKRKNSKETPSSFMYNKSKISAKEALLLSVATGIHNFLGDKNPVHKLIANGKHHLQGGEIQKNRFLNGSHPNQQQHTCNYCSKTGTGPGMFRHHFEKCKYKNIDIEKDLIEKNIKKQKTQRHTDNANTRVSNGTNPFVIKISCEYCGKIGDKGNIRRWHGINCKNQESLETLRRDTTLPLLSIE